MGASETLPWRGFYQKYCGKSERSGTFVAPTPDFGVRGSYCAKTQTSKTDACSRVWERESKHESPDASGRYVAYSHPEITAANLSESMGKLFCPLW
jgi:hypothetical protein